MKANVLQSVPHLMWILVFFKWAPMLPCASWIFLFFLDDMEPKNLIVLVSPFFSKQYPSVKRYSHFKTPEQWKLQELSYKPFSMIVYIVIM